MAFKGFEEMNIYDLNNAILEYEEKNNLTDEELDEVNALFWDAWRKEFPNLTFEGDFDSSYDEVIGKFKEVTIDCGHYFNEVLKLSVNNKLHLEFPEEKELTSWELLRILDKIGLPDFQNHSFFQGFMLEENNTIYIHCGS